MKYRITLEETSSRLFTREVEAESADAAAAIGHAALDDDSWTEWDESSSDASLAVYGVDEVDSELAEFDRGVQVGSQLAREQQQKRRRS